MWVARSRWAVVVLAALWAVAVSGVHGEIWTNAAGHAIEAQLTALDNDVVHLRLLDGSAIRLPLASLAESEQRRARRVMGIKDIPVSVRADFKQCRRTLTRLNQLRNTGAISDAECRRRRAMALESLRKACLREELNEERSAAVLRQAGEDRS